MANEFKYTVSLTRVSDGDTIAFQDEWGWATYVRKEWWESDPVFIWTEGNYSCNCNRFLFYWRAKGKTEEEIDDLDPNKGENGYCSAYEDFQLNWIRNDETGNIIYGQGKPVNDEIDVIWEGK